MRRGAFFVGGTGQMVLHWYLQLYLLGLVKEPFDAYVLDTDRLIGSLEVYRKFLTQLQYGAQQEQALGCTLPAARLIEIPIAKRPSAWEVLTGQTRHDAGWKHPVEAFFDRGTLLQDLRLGLYARPALAALLSGGLLRGTELAPEKDCTVVVVGSVIGGTGGGLIAPLIDELQAASQTQGQMRIRAILFGEFFKPDPKRVEGDRVRFRSNQLMVLKSLGESLEHLHSYAVIGGSQQEKLVARDPEEEKKGVQIPLPSEEAHPFWTGAKALDHLFTEATRDKKLRVTDREMPVGPELRPNLDQMQTRMGRAMGLVDRLVGANVVRRLWREPWAARVWGEPLCELVAHYWGLAAGAEGGKAKTRDFPAQVQVALGRIWHGAEEDGLRDAFAGMQSRRRAVPADVKKTGWPSPKAGGAAQPLFSSGAGTAERAAASMIFWGLRTGAV